MPEIISRKEAKARGLKKYFTGKECVRGHLSSRLGSTGACLECSYILCKRWREDNPESHRISSNKWKKNNRQKTREAWGKYYKKNRKEILQKKRLWKSKNAEKYKEKCRLYQKKNSAKITEKIRLRRQKNPEKHREENKRWSEKNPEKVIRYRLYGPSNPRTEAQWLRKNQAQLRTVRRLLRNMKKSNMSQPELQSQRPG